MASTALGQDTYSAPAATCCSTPSAHRCLSCPAATADTDLEEATPPEILDADLAPLALELALWGCPYGSDLPWLDPPDEERLTGACELLQDLGAVDGKGAVTAEGEGAFWLACIIHHHLSLAVLR
jgi:HrpA-like RNA helicase